MFQDPTRDFEVSRSEGSLAMPDMHLHDYYELYYLEAGSRDYFVEDSIFSVKAGDFVLIAPGKLHRTGGEYGMRLLVCFTDGFLLRTFTKEASGKFLRSFDKVMITPPEARRGEFARLLARVEEAADEIEFAVALARLLQELEACEQSTVAKDPVSAMVAYINANYANITNLTQIADQFYISKYHLCRVFKAAMKMTVVDYLNRVRIRNACRYLRASNKDMGEIAQLCGFHDAAYFSNVFRKQMGQSPSRYRKER